MIAVDAMGGDFAPKVAVLGAVRAARAGIASCLFGDRPQLERLLSAVDSNWSRLPLSIEHCSEVIAMGDEPGRAVVKKKDSSLVRAMHAVADGKASAFFSAGNSGAVLVAATLILGRSEGILRPALGDYLPTKNGYLFCIDLGANTDVKPEYLEQFAVMGSVWVRLTKKIENPRVALLSNGHEPYKGSIAVKEAYGRLERAQHINFTGNLEPRDIFDNRTDVLVCDGFVGNVLLKTVQGTAQAMMYWLKHETEISWWRRLIGIISLPLFSGLKKRLDYASKGGALLFGVRHPVVVAHGCSNEYAVENGIRFVHQVVLQKSIEQFNAEVSLHIKQQRRPNILMRMLRALFKKKGVHE
jgi:glycerol-3-phosphate acyltransferase PlsX